MRKLIDLITNLSEDFSDSEQRSREIGQRYKRERLEKDRREAERRHEEDRRAKLDAAHNRIERREKDRRQSREDRRSSVERREDNRRVGDWMKRFDKLKRGESE